ncbi:DUF1501 domain-containing protein [Rhodobacter sp. SY28-1]|uniref:DUF1501 domain-containing protein n=1 Tax=Rhodobacter sp. SY28-1 TaxID=2562317 RepID=UPI0010C0AD2D|nr:DUF1501 domain-containing protein [Rhodobacter sp. SY28-1]
MDRRIFLKGLGAVGCSAAAHPLMTTLTLAAAPGENRLAVIILRGAMDGLDVVQPRGDRDLAAARPGVLAKAQDLDGFFALHEGLSGLMPLWQAGELAFVHATSTPYRDKRSHFDGQDLLEAGTGTDLAPAAQRDGWLNRLLGVLPGATSETAWAVGREAMPILTGAAPAESWAPDQDLAVSAPARALLEQVYAEDALFHQASATAFGLAGMEEGEGQDTDMIVDFVAERLRGPARIAAFSLTGWDTHKGQERAIRKPLDRLQRAVLRLKDGARPEVWGKTVVLAMTEFGRTVRQNGSGGTDHGTGGAMLVAGGAVRGGKVLGRWPGLAEADLYDRRDLMPTSDVRDWAAQAMAGLFGLDRSVLEGTVFPKLAMTTSDKLIR